MKFYIGPQQLPQTATAWQQAGTQIVSSLDQEQEYIANMWPGQSFPESSDNISCVQRPMAGMDGLF